ncbi:MAG: hypothetical protein QOG62_1896 [Thermoleophilaceae bacterium]|nr:hypothetical protein [Thermoleophilaceae bacterium]
MTGKQPRVFLRLEGLALFAAALGLYFHQEFGVLALIIFILAPDLSLLGYLANDRAGALFYNLFHTTIGPLAVAAVGVVRNDPLFIQIALIWLAHIGADRMLGLGLKYDTGIRDTHLT